MAVKSLVADVRSDDEGETEDEKEDGKGDVSDSDLSRQVSAVETTAALERIEPGVNGSANGNGHVNAVKALTGLGLGIDARKGSLKEGSDEDENDSYVRANGQVLGERKKDL